MSEKSNGHAICGCSEGELPGVLIYRIEAPGYFLGVYSARTYSHLAASREGEKY